MNRRTLLSLAISACLAAAATAQTPSGGGPIIKAGTTQKITPHVYVIPDASTPGVPNVGIIVGTKGTLVIDTGMGKPNGETVLTEAKKVMGNTKLYLVTTHVHPEHDLGAQAFPADTTLIRAKSQVGEIAEEGFKTADAFRGRSEINKKLLEGAEFRTANVTFDKDYSLDLGGVTVKLYALGPGHTQGDTAMFVEGDKVLFSGDLAMRAMPAFASSKSSAKTWLSALDKFDALKPTIIVPSHGPNGDLGYVATYRTYITRISSRAAALKKEGKSVEQATETITAELKADNIDTSRAAGAIRAAYNEAP